MTSTARRIAAGFTAATLAVSLAACSGAKDAANSAKDAASSAAAEATAAAGSAAAAAGSAAADATAAAGSAINGAAAELTSVNTPAGAVEVPAAFAAAITAKAAEWGVDVQEIKSTDLGSLAVFAQDKLLTFSNETKETVPVVGKIAETFQAEGGLESGLGLPVAAEKAATDAEGWVQDFTNGAISWVKGQDGAFAADVQKA